LIVYDNLPSAFPSTERKPKTKTKIMNNTLHTDGPWAVRYTDNGLRIVYSDGEIRSHVADLHSMSLCEEHGSLRANANLIAAAPDLLSALEGAYNAIAWDIPGGKLDDQEEETLLDVIRAAIAKAKGEA
jgi:hypothetical protein